MMDPRPLFKDHIQKIVADVQQNLNDSDFDSVAFFSGEQEFYYADDVEIPFKPAAHFARFVPVRKPNKCVVVDVKSNTPTYIAHIPKNYWLDQAEEEDFWEDSFKIIRAESLEDWHKEIESRIGKVGVYVGPKCKGLKRGLWNPKSFIKKLDQLRVVKTPYEIACMKKANSEAVKGHVRVQEAFLAGASEKELYWEYLKALNATEEDMPYEPTIALNEKGSIIHYRNRRDLKNGLSCLVDAGMNILGYGSDITRTYAGKKAHPVFVSLIESIDTLQQELVLQAQDGFKTSELEHNTQLGVGKILKEHNLISIDAEEAVSNNITYHFLPHSVWHSIGLQTHDVGGRTRSTVLKNGAVTTIEPGIYFNPLIMDALKKKKEGSSVNWKLVDELMPFGGIRIEDNIHVTDGGPKNLTRNAFAMYKRA